MRTKVFVVSLPDAAARRQRFTERAAGATVDWTFFDAHRTLAEGLTYDPAMTRLHHGRDLQPGELGCYSSHATLWKQLIADDVDQYIILEDDVLVDWNAIARIAQHPFAERGHHYVRLYYIAPCPFLILDRDYIGRSVALLHLLGKPYGTQGYVLTRAGATKLLATANPVRRPIDDQMDKFWEHGVPNLSIFPFPIVEEAGTSSIGESRFEKPTKLSFERKLYRFKDRWTERLAILKIRLAAKLGKFAGR